LVLAIPGKIILSANSPYSNGGLRK